MESRRAEQPGNLVTGRPQGGRIRFRAAGYAVFQIVKEIEASE